MFVRSKLKQRRLSRNGKPIGRPPVSSYSFASVESLLDQLRNGETLSAICRQPGMPTIGVVLSWVDHDGHAPVAQFSERFARAQRQGWQAMGYSLIDTAKNARGKDMPGVAAEKLVIDTIKWLLARRLPQEFGDRLQIDGGATAAQINIYLPRKGSANDGAPIIDAKAVEVDVSDGGSEPAVSLLNRRDSGS